MSLNAHPTETQTRPYIVIEPATEPQDEPAPLSTAELRRQMYERIARGNALVEAEAEANRKWQGR